MTSKGKEENPPGGTAAVPSCTSSTEDNCPHPMYETRSPAERTARAVPAPTTRFITQPRQGCSLCLFHARSIPNTATVIAYPNLLTLLAPLVPADAVLSRPGRLHGREDVLPPEARLHDVPFRDLLPHEPHVRGVRLPRDEVPPAPEEPHGVLARPDPRLDPVALPAPQVLPDILDDVHELLRVALAEDLRGHLCVEVHDAVVKRL